MLIRAQGLTGRPNPYITQLYEEIERMGHTVTPIRSHMFKRPLPDIIHVHWPEHFVATTSRLKSDLLARAWIAYMRFVIGRGTKLIYTVHNIRGHEIVNEGAQSLVNRFMVEECHGWISLTEDATRQVLEEYPSLEQKPHRIIPLGDYRAVYTRHWNRASARKALGIGENQKVALLFGNLRGYKGAEVLIDLFKAPPLDGEEYCLLVAGSASDPEAFKALESERVKIFPTYIPDDDVSKFFAAADVATLPFLRILNSSSAMLALSFDVPVLAPRTGSLIALERSLPDVVELFDGELRADVVKGALDRFATHGQPPIDLSEFEWPRIAADTLDLYRSVMAGGRA